MITNKCPECFKVIQSAEEHRGKKAKCPVCSEPFVIGQERAAGESETIGLADGPKLASPAKSKASASGGKPSSAKTPAKSAKSPVAAKAPAVELPPGKVECPTCHELVSDELSQCPYCQDLIDRGGGKKKRK